MDDPSVQPGTSSFSRQDVPAGGGAGCAQNSDPSSAQAGQPGDTASRRLNRRVTARSSGNSGGDGDNGKPAGTVATSRGKPLLRKVYEYQDSRQVRANGLYSYFRCIQSCQNPVVKIEGREFIMMGSNNYLGLVSEPRDSP